MLLDADVQRLEQGLALLGGDPGRLLRLTADGSRGLEQLAQGRPVGDRVLALARTLVDGGLAHPRPRPAHRPGDLVVVVPVRDRAQQLARCLAALGRDVPVLVVDDGSRDPAAVAEVCRRAGADVLALPVNGGPAAARNAGLAATSSPLVAFVDSDCVPPAGWLPALTGHFADPLVAAVAPRVRGAAGGRSLLAAYARERGPLDLGDRESRVRPGGRVPYVPTAALVVRRVALGPVAGSFDARLRYGEDVDLVWRLHDAGWTVRYDPRTVVGHEEPDRWRDWLVRRYRYGTSAGPLSVRHGARVTPLVVSPVALLAWSLLAAGQPARALAVACLPAVALHRALRRTGLPPGDCARTALRVTWQGVLATGAGLGGAGSVVTAPVLLPLLLLRRTRRTAVVLLLAPPLLERRGRRLEVGPVPWLVVRLVDDLAYALGVWRGAWAAGTTAPLRPRRTRPR